MLKKLLCPLRYVVLGQEKKQMQEKNQGNNTDVPQRAPLFRTVGTTQRLWTKQPN